MFPSAQRQKSRLPKQFRLAAPYGIEGLNGEEAKLDPAICNQVLAIVPSLRAFATSLSGNVDRGNDLVQETLLRALSHIGSFEPGTNLAAWLFTILRNQFRDEKRKRQREVEDVDGRHAETLTSLPEQTGRIEFEELRAALAKLPAEQREALILIGASDFSYDEAAAICGCPAGTLKSRVSRARIRLAELLAIDGARGLAVEAPSTPSPR